MPKGYLYSAMIFSVFIELINMAQRRKAAAVQPQPVHLRNPYGPEHPEEHRWIDEDETLTAMGSRPGQT